LITLQAQLGGVNQQVIAQYRDGPAVSAFQTLADNLRRLRSRVDAANRGADRKEEAARNRVGEFSIGCVITALVMLVVVRLIARFWLSRPLGLLAHAVRRSDDDPHPVVRRGPSEITQLAAEIDTLRDRAREEVDLARRTREGLSQNAAVLMSLRAQLEASPDVLPPGWSVSAQLVPATGIVAGDCYNVDVVGQTVVTIVVVDVAGHGASSAVAALRAKELLRAAIRSYDDPADAVAWVSSQLSDLGSDMFVTAFIARLDFTTGLLRYVNAGHPEALVSDGVNTAELGVTGPLIGPFPGEWTTREAIIGGGQMLVCYTDGLIEVRNDKKEEFGLERLQRVLRDNYGDDTESIVKQCLTEVDSFGGGRSHDDVTLVVIARALDH
jgi:sigma-B regulation protein RsbU (phosphoserine phosphatase)